MKEKFVNFLDKQGFYIVLGICLVVIATTAVVTMTGGSNKDTANTEITTENASDVNATIEETTTKKATQNNAKAQKLVLGRPVEGEVITKFAKENLVYNETLKQWATHEGIDIACTEDAVVRAVLGGTVENVEEDALSGHTIVILHDNGHKSIYCNLDGENIKVKKGDKVQKGTELAKVGKSALNEYNMETHLHFEYLIEENTVDPMEYIEGLKTRQ